jgi:isopenicillin N synthase-like dioxygenase
MRILSLFAQGLEIDEAKGGSGWFEERHDRGRGKSGSVFRFLYYPALPPSFQSKENGTGTEEDETDIRCGAHSDYGSITLLFRRDLPGQAGLEILTEDGSWAGVPVNPNSHQTNGVNGSNGHVETEPPPILVNVGDLLSFWTHGLLKSTVHRVVFPKEVENADRYSIAYFCHPLDEAKLEGVPSKLVEGMGDGTRDVMTAKEHLESRLNATYS